MKKFRSTFLLLLTAIIWGLAFVAQRVGAEHVGAFTFNAVRFVIGVAALVPVALIFERGAHTKAELKRTVTYGIATGVILCTASNLQQFGVVFTASAGKSAFITGLYTVLVPIAYLIFFRRRTGVNVWIGAALAVVGLYLLCGVSGSFGRGDVWLFIGALFWAGHIIIIDHANEAGVLPIRYSMVQFATAGVISAVFALVFEDITLQGILDAGIPILYAGVMSTGVAYTCQVLGQRNADPAAAAIVLSTESLWAAVGGALILSETMSVPAYVGCALMFAGIVVSQLRFGKDSE